MSARLRVGLLFGGASVEHEVSVVSARGVARALDAAGYECIPIAVTGDGRWLGPTASGAALGGDAARVEPPSSDSGGFESIVVRPGSGLFIADDGRGAEPLHLDVVFPVLHGWGGEDGRLQGLLDLAGVPYVGAGVAGSAVGMDKAAAKGLLAFHGIPVVPWVVLTRAEHDADPGAARRRVGAALGYPLFVKPSSGGSSVGVARVAREDALPAALEAAFACDRKVLVERAVPAREIECAVLGNERPEVSVPGEVVPSGEFYDYAAKYLDGTSGLLIPAPLAAGQADEIRRLAVLGFRALDLAGMARVDFFLDRDTGAIYLNEVNTLPGFTPISMYPKLWEASGVAYPALLGRLVGLALERRDGERQRRARLAG